MTTVDLEPATRRLADLVSRISDDQLGRATPCPDYTLGDLIDHVGGLSLAFTAAAQKVSGGAGSQGPSGDASRLGDDWRARIPGNLAALAQAWKDPAAWEGMTEAGGVELPGQVAGLVALNEVIIHGWDIARASGQPYDLEQPLLEVAYRFVSEFSGSEDEDDEDGDENDADDIDDMDDEESDPGAFGPPVPVPDDAPLLDRVIALSGRDPAWSPEGT